MNDVITGLRTLFTTKPTEAIPMVEGPDHTFILVDSSLEFFQRCVTSNIKNSLANPTISLLRKAMSATERLQGIDMKE